MYQLLIQSPVGPLTLSGDAAALTAVSFGDALTESNSSPLLEQAARELEEYFAGKRQVFTIPLSPAGTPFQRQVWDALREIPYGRTSSYKDIALRIGNSNACRAVGMANNRNPLPILIPCHRVVGADGKLVGYAGGLEVKQTLLELERRNILQP